MRQAMAQADVGDDDYGEDPTVNTLEAAYAERVGKAAAIFVPSGVMANQIAIRLLAPAGTVVVAGRRQHVVAYELGASARNAGIQFHLVDDSNGLVDPGEVLWAREAPQYHLPQASLVCIENTHMVSCGSPWSLEDLNQLKDACGPLPIHMDGARLFNAEIATGTAAAEMARGMTTVMSCLSKGLCAPVGSLLAGPADLIEQARVERKRLGGGMRQAGVLAAPGLIALETMVERLSEDHVRAKMLADAVAERWPDCGLDPSTVRTNIVTFTHRQSAALLAHLETHGVRAGMVEPNRVRLVTHRDIDDDGIEQAKKALSSSPS